MRLSCLIPVYRLDASRLINDLTVQCRELQIDFEILVLDDSAEYRDVNWQVQLDQQEVKFINPTRNLGRALARNRLLAEMTGDFGLFLDGDMRIAENFLAGYVQAIEAYPDSILVGGIVYEKGESLRHAIGKKERVNPHMREMQTHSMDLQLPMCYFPEKLPSITLSPIKFELRT